MKRELTAIASYLTNKRVSKKHGGYAIYEDDRIYISYDTYYPNLSVYVFIDGEKTLAASYSGHGHVCEYHRGAWEAYVSDILYPKALKAKEELAIVKKEEQRKEAYKKHCPLNDSSVFS